MKIITSKSTAAKPEFPANYICSQCGSEIQLEKKEDIKTVAVPHPLEDNKEYTLPGKAFTCPVCTTQNLIG